MNRHKTGKNLKGQEQNICSALLDDVKQKVRLLRENGVSESEIASLFYVDKPLPMLIIRKDYRFFLGESRKEIRMEPLVKAIFLLFLKHPEGILFKHLPDYREELAQIYDKLRPLGLNERSIQSIEDVTNPLLNSINEKCARIRGAFLEQFDEHLAKNYFITGKRGEAKKITLPRNLVVWE